MNRLLNNILKNVSIVGKTSLCFVLSILLTGCGDDGSAASGEKGNGADSNSDASPDNNDTDNHNLIADHTVSKESVLRRIPEAAITAAKENLIILYNGTSHSTQVLNGMRGLEQYKSGDDDRFALSMNADTPSPTALDIRYNYIGGDHLDNDAIGESGYPQYYDSTVRYLDEHEEVNVVVWGWHNSDGHDVQIYLDAFDALIDLYRAGGTRGRTEANDVTFVFMSGRAFGNAGDDPDAVNSPFVNAEKIREHCIAGGYLMIDYWRQDVYHYETNEYDPYVDSDANPLHYDYVTTHTLGEDWFESRNFITGDVEYAAHTDENPDYLQHLTGNIRAYGAWWVWARAAGWDGVLEEN